MEPKYQTTEAGTKYYFDKDGHCINEHGRRDILLGMAIAGENLAKAPLLINNHWANAMNEPYSDITSTFSVGDDLSEDIKELKALQAKHQAKK